MQSQIVHHQHGGQSFVGREAVSVFQCKVIASGAPLLCMTPE
jgi:hypothetical protein